jgi:hypothetical protein
MTDAVWDPTVFTKNRDRLLAGDVAAGFFEQVLFQAKQRKLLSSEHFTVDGTLVEAWASQKSFRPKAGAGKGPDDEDPGNPSVDFHGEKRSNQTHVSRTDPEALLAKIQGKEAKLCFRGHVLTENRNGLVVEASLTPADGYAEREAAVAMLESIPGRRRITVGADRAYDAAGFVARVRQLGVTPHVAQYVDRPSAIDQRTTRHAGYAASQRRRKRVEEVFGWMKTIGLMRKVRHRGVARVGWMFILTAAAYNLVRMRNLAEAT